MSGEQDTLIGATLEGRFHIEKLLGEGGMGRVYVADETRLRRRCAVKVLLPELTQNKDNVERFLREAQSIAQIHHENVVDIHHLGEDEALGVVFFAMELLSGEDLEMRLADRKKRRVDWLDVTRWMSQVASAMAAVHAAGLIHRDLKPSNIFLHRRRDGREQVKLLDFGIAKGFNRSALTGTGAALGTPYYMSPEQILAEPLDPRTDIYSLGVLFFEAVAGRMPFVGEPIQVAMQHCNVLPNRPTEINPELEVPPELEALIMSMLEKGRDVRIQSMEEVEAQLQMFLPTMGNSTITGPLARPLTYPPTEASQQSLVDTSQPGASVSSTAPTGQFPPHRRDVRANSLEIVFDQTVDDSQTKTNTTPTAVPRTRKLALMAAVGMAALLLIVIAIAMSRGDPPAQTTPPVAQTPTPTVTPPAKPPETPPVTPPTTPPDPVATTAEPAGDTADSAGDDDGKETPTKVDNPTKKPPDPTKKPPVTAEKSPVAQIKKLAAACRKTHNAVKGDKITIRYVVSRDGKVSRADPPKSDALGKCLADAVARTKFPPADSIRFNQTIEL